MRWTKISNFTGIDTKKNSFKSKNPEDYVFDLDKDMRNLGNLVNGRVRFGDGVDGARGENISGEFQVFTSDGVADAENTIAHTLGAVPIGYIVLNQDKAGSLYDSGTAWTATNIYLKSDVASVTFKVFLLK